MKCSHKREDSMKIILLSLLIIAGCSKKAEISCDSGNLDALTSAAEDYIVSNLRDEKSTQKYQLSNTKPENGSCVLNKRQQNIRWKIKTDVLDGPKVKRSAFECRYGKIRTNTKDDIACQLTF